MNVHSKNLCPRDSEVKSTSKAVPQHPQLVRILGGRQIDE